MNSKGFGKVVSLFQRTMQDCFPKDCSNIPSFFVRQKEALNFVMVLSIIIFPCIGCKDFIRSFTNINQNLGSQKLHYTRSIRFGDFHIQPDSPPIRPLHLVISWLIQDLIELLRALFVGSRIYCCHAKYQSWAYDKLRQIAIRLRINFS